MPNSSCYYITVKFLIVAVALIRMKNPIFQYLIPKVHLRLLLEVLYEKFNHRAAIALDCHVGITQPLMSNGQDMPYESI